MLYDKAKQLAAARRVHEAVHRVNALVRAAAEVGVQFEHVNCDGDAEFIWKQGQERSGTVAMMREEFAEEVQP